MPGQLLAACCCGRAECEFCETSPQTARVTFNSVVIDTAFNPGLLGAYHYQVSGTLDGTYDIPLRGTFNLFDPYLLQDSVCPDQRLLALVGCVWAAIIPADITITWTPDNPGDYAGQTGCSGCDPTVSCASSSLAIYMEYNGGTTNLRAKLFSTFYSDTQTLYDTEHANLFKVTGSEFVPCGTNSTAGLANEFTAFSQTGGAGDAFVVGKDGTADIQMIL